MFALRKCVDSESDHPTRIEIMSINDMAIKKRCINFEELTHRLSGYVSHGYCAMLYAGLNLFGCFRGCGSFQIAVEEVEEYALPEHCILRLEHPVVLIGEHEHFRLQAVHLGRIEGHHAL